MEKESKKFSTRCSIAHNVTVQAKNPSDVANAMEKEHFNKK